MTSQNPIHFRKQINDEGKMQLKQLKSHSLCKSNLLLEDADESDPEFSDGESSFESSES
jgi:hypothetical protein